MKWPLPLLHDIATQNEWMTFAGITVHMQVFAISVTLDMHALSGVQGCPVASKDGKHSRNPIRQQSFSQVDLLSRLGETAFEQFL